MRTFTNAASELSTSTVSAGVVDREVELITDFVVKTSTAKMPAGCWGRYHHVALVEMEAGAPFPKMISTHAKGVVRIVLKTSRLHVGSTMKSEYRQILREYEMIADKLNVILDGQYIPREALMLFVEQIRNEIDAQQAS